MDGLQDIDPESDDGEEIEAALAALEVVSEVATG
jgi:hypothetical protein